MKNESTIIIISVIGIILSLTLIESIDIDKGIIRFIYALGIFTGIMLSLLTEIIIFTNRDCFIEIRKRI